MSKPKKEARTTGRRYGSIGDLMKATDTPEEVQEGVNTLARETQLATCLVRLRQKAGFSQAKMAELLGCSQSRISKLEASRDEELTLGEIRDYARHTGTAIEARIGPPLNHVEAVKRHALEIRRHLEALARLRGFAPEKK